MKKIISLTVAFLATLVLVGCGSAELTPKQEALVQNKTELYTQVSMWVDRNKVSGTNFANGLHMPVNSKVKILEVSSSVIQLEYLGAQIRYDITTKHTKQDAQKTLDRLFSTQKVDLSKFSKKTQASIKDGKVEIGMSKEAVLLARGYPPMHATLSTQADLWKYWYHRFKTSTVTFKDNKVIEKVGGIM